MPGRGLLLQQRQQLEAIDAGHDDVQKDQGIVAGLGVVQSALGGVDHGDVVDVIQDRFEKIGLNGAVVDDQNSLHGDAPFTMTPAGECDILFNRMRPMAAAAIKILYQSFSKRESTNLGDIP